VAYSFNGSNQSVSATSAPVLDVPLSICCWAYPNNVTTDGYLVNVGATDSNAFIGLSLEGTTANDPVAAVYRNAATTSGVSSKASYVANAWQNVAGAFPAINSRTVYLEGAAGTTNTGNITSLGTMSVLGIAFLNRQTPALWSNARVAEVAMWSVALSADEIASLAKGFKPTRIRPQSLVFYAPLIRNAQDTKGGLALTNNNSATVADHPRVY
jgi:hypothetical protein